VGIVDYLHINNQHLILLGFLIMFITTSIGILTSHWLSRWILRISQVSKTLIEKEPSEMLTNPQSITELRILTDSLHEMVTKVQQSFEQSENRYLQLAEQQRDFILRSHPDTTINFANQALCDALGCSLEEIKGKKWLDFADPNDLQSIITQISRLNPEKSSFLAENRDHRGDGTIGWTQWLNQGIFDEQGALIAIHSVGRDITKLKHIEIALRESEARWQLAVEGAGDGTWDWNPQTNEVHFSRQWKAMLGYEEQEISNNLSEWDSRVHPEDKIQCYEDIATYLRGETEVYQNEHRLKCKNGTYKWILDRGQVVERDEKNQPLRFISTHTDINDRKSIELALQESEAIFQKIALSSPGIIYIFVKCPNGSRYFEYVSSAVKDIYEYTFEQLLGNVNLYLEQIHPEDLKDYEAKFAQSSENLAPFFHEWRIITPSGKIKWVQARSRCERRKNGDIAWYGVTLDVTDRKEAELETWKLQNFLNSIIENIPNMVFVKDAQNLQFVRLNKAGEELLGYSKENLLGKSDNDLFPPEEAKFFIAKDREVLESGKILDIPEEIIHTNNGTRFLHTKKLAISDEFGQPQYLLGISEDITERKQAEIALRESEARFQKISSSSPGVIYILVHRVDGSKYFEYISSAVENIFEITVEQFLADSSIYLKHTPPRGSGRLSRSHCS